MDVWFPSTQIEPAPSSQHPLELLVMEGSGLATYPLPLHGTMSIGRAEESDVRIDDPLASRNHAILRLGPLTVEDRRSVNGTRIQGSRIEAGKPVPLKPGEAISIGKAVIVVQAMCGGSGARQKVNLRGRSASGVSHAPVVIHDRAMVELFRVLERVAAAPVNLLVLGETGVGKDVVAEAAHGFSPRAKSPFVRINCAALPENLLESELFGYEAGSFTGAVKAKVGLLETAENGTVFLDEIGELPRLLQAKLLRVIEAREVTRVGALRARPVDVRFISATNRDLEKEIARGGFRSDLYFRLNGVGLLVPPLRERPSEIEPLARMFVQRMAEQLALEQVPELTEEALARLREHTWPGNVRELRNVVERTVLLSSSQKHIDSEHLALDAWKQFGRGSEPPDVFPRPAELSRQATEPGASADGSQRRGLERLRIVDALQRCHGNQSRAAKLLDMPRRTLVAKLAAYDIPRPRKTPLSD
jgi:two-component system response regulator AtoC